MPFEDVQERYGCRYLIIVFALVVQDRLFGVSWRKHLARLPDVESWLADLHDLGVHH